MDRSQNQDGQKIEDAKSVAATPTTSSLVSGLHHDVPAEDLGRHVQVGLGFCSSETRESDESDRGAGSDRLEVVGAVLEDEF